MAVHWLVLWARIALHRFVGHVQLVAAFLAHL